MRKENKVTIEDNENRTSRKSTTTSSTRNDTNRDRTSEKDYSKQLDAILELLNEIKKLLPKRPLTSEDLC